MSNQFANCPFENNSIQIVDPATILVPKIKLREKQEKNPMFAELCASVKKDGIKQDITVRPEQDENGVWKLAIVDGLQRLSAAIDVGLTEVRAKCEHITAAEALLVQIVANEQRMPTKRCDLAVQLNRLLEESNYTMTLEKMALLVSKSTKWVEDTLALRKVAPAAADLFHKNEITVANALQLARLKPEEQLSFLAAAQIDSTGEFKRKLDDFIAEQKAAAKGQPKAIPTFVAEPKSRKQAELLAYLNDPVLGAGVRFALSLDEETVAKAKAAWEAEQVAAARRREEATAKREAARAAKAKEEEAKAQAAVAQ